MGTSPRLLPAILRSIVVSAIPLASCSVFEPPPLRGDGGGDAGATDTGLVESGSDVSSGGNADVTDDKGIGPDADGNGANDTSSRDVGSGNDSTGEMDVADVTVVDG